MEHSSKLFSMSFSPTDTYFQILNYITILICIFVIKMIFYDQRHISRFYYFLALLGAIHAVLATFLYLNGNPDILFLKHTPYKYS